MKSPGTGIPHNILMTPTMHWAELSSIYLLHIRKYKKQSSVDTVDLPAIRAFGDFLRSVGNPGIDKITTAHADDFYYLSSKNNLSSSVRTRIVAVRLVFKFAISAGIITVNPFHAVRLPPARFAGRILSDDEIRVLLPLLDQTSRRVFLLALYTGLRRGEVCSIEWSQIQGDCLTIPPEKSKSGRGRTLLLQPCAVEALGPRSSGLIFKTTPIRLNRALNAAWKKAGIGRVRFHDLRHTAATRFMEKSDDIYAMLDAFGWKSEASAKPYQHITRPRQERIFNIHYNL